MATAVIETRPRGPSDTPARRNSTLFRRVSAQAMGMEADSLCRRSHWVPKSSRTKCSNCARLFKLFNKKHHCRLCGEVVCGACSTKRILFQKKSVRSCDECINQSVQVISCHNRRASSGDLVESDLSSDESPTSDRDEPVGFSSGCNSNNTRPTTSTISVSTRRSQFHYEDAIIHHPEAWRTQAPYAIVLFLMTVAGITNLLAVL